MKNTKITLFISMILFVASLNARTLKEVEYVRDYIQPDGTEVIIGKVKNTNEEIEVRNINNVIKVGRILREDKTTQKLSPIDTSVYYETLQESKAEKEKQ
jgi:hypothetical protein